MRRYEPKKLSELLADRDECVKNDIYKNLLRISLLADVVNEATERCRSVLRKYGIEDFNFRKKVVEMSKLSQEIASVVLLPDNKTLEDLIVDDDTFVVMCMKHADAHLKRKLKTMTIWTYRHSKRRKGFTAVICCARI